MVYIRYQSKYYKEAPLYKWGVAIADKIDPYENSVTTFVLRSSYRHFTVSGQLFSSENHMMGGNEFTISKTDDHYVTAIHRRGKPQEPEDKKLIILLMFEAKELLKKHIGKK